MSTTTATSCSIRLGLALLVLSTSTCSANFLRTAWHHVEDAILPIHDQEQEQERRDLEARIVGGSSVSSAPYWFVNWHNGCGGSVIGRDKVLTAAHCWSSNLEDYRLSIGSLDLDDSSAPFVTHAIDAEIHPRNDPSKGELYDVMILRLADPIPMEYYQPIALNQDDATPSNGESLTVMGFGWTSESGSGGMSDNLRSVDVDYIQDCHSSDYSYHDYPYLYPTGAHLCAGVEDGGKDSCAGDSGGPIYKSINGEPTQVGIVSWGDGCARDDAPGVYARVSAAYDWIQDTRCDPEWTDAIGYLHASCNAATPSPTAPPTVPPTQAPTQAPTDLPKYAVRVDIHTDNFPTETSWELLHQASSSSDPVVLARVNAGAYQTADTDYSSRVYDLPTTGTFTLTVTDADGICCSFGQGKVAIYQIPNSPPPQGTRMTGELLAAENAAKHVVLAWEGDAWTVQKEGSFSLR